MTESTKNVKDSKRKVTVTRLRTVLKDAVFNPQKPGPMKVVMESHNASFFSLRAIEEIRYAEDCRNRTASHKHLNMAIRLLALARLEKEN